LTRLLRKKDLVEILGLPKSTISDWLIEFHVYVPKVKQGAITFYKPEAVDVLKAIKELREQGYHKVQIFEILAERGFPVTVDEAVEDMKRVLQMQREQQPRDAVFAVAQTAAQLSAKMSEIDEAVQELGRKQDETDGRIAELERQLEAVRRELEQTKAELAAERAKPWWRKLFR